jgi:hypothetical protein
MIVMHGRFYRMWRLDKVQDRRTLLIAAPPSKVGMTVHMDRPASYQEISWDEQL